MKIPKISLDLNSKKCFWNRKLTSSKKYFAEIRQLSSPLKFHTTKKLFSSPSTSEKVLFGAMNPASQRRNFHLFHIFFLLLLSYSFISLVALRSLNYTLNEEKKIFFCIFTSPGRERKKKQIWGRIFCLLCVTISRFVFAGYFFRGLLCLCPDFHLGYRWLFHGSLWQKIFLNISTN